MTELAVLQAVRLKGRVTPADLAATLNQDIADITDIVERLTASGLLVDGATLRISPSGRARLETLLAEERAGIDSAALAAAYDDFRAVNADFKALVTDWQLKGGMKTGQAGTPNAHDDAEYDAAVLARLDDVHARAVSIIEAAASQLPRFHAYSAKLLAALDKIKKGETAWLARPVIDSYHTVWFELHEELIGAIGLTREEAARSGDAQ
ncbi:MarR family transcriptional regulator [Mycobacterium malmoense]|uniref:MarR family transcriptional regulator n=1 Tax=Mycobacterium malmoense TaxID=1780 RepID=A0ABX3SLF7_MYCMA|nr:MarR family transcriptional regulator [Mycobacterium malmoense]ORA78138.1 MarR family transcriptional regulator [Mycobacterium malmoense]QZA16692.1 MarR family transcriptional regulator [Mycobacterium malmoense]UNB93490.1 MarR family transcriptional regulator [Mycobacterium malmoense]